VSGIRVFYLKCRAYKHRLPEVIIIGKSTGSLTAKIPFEEAGMIAGRAADSSLVTLCLGVGVTRSYSWQTGLVIETCEMWSRGKPQIDG
jgi:hypothetical protein